MKQALKRQTTASLQKPKAEHLVNRTAAAMMSDLHVLVCDHQKSEILTTSRLSIQVTQQDTSPFTQCQDNTFEAHQ